MRRELGWDGLLLVGELGPTFLLIQGGSAGPQKGLLYVPECSNWASSDAGLADAFSDEEEVRSATGAADQTTQQLATAARAQKTASTCLLRARSAGQYTANASQLHSNAQHCGRMVYRSADMLDFTKLALQIHGRSPSVALQYRGGKWMHLSRMVALLAIGTQNPHQRCVQQRNRVI